MNRENDLHDDIIDLGVASELTQGTGSSAFPDEHTGQKNSMGLSDD